MTRLFKLVAVLSSFSFLTWSCGRTDSVTGNVEDGFSSLIEITDEQPGDNCEAGGMAIHTGLDENRNGVLDIEEIATTKYVCHGEGGHPTLFESEDEPPGGNCPAGGTVFRWGLDADDDGILDAEEVTATEYICDGLPGDTHTSLVNTLDEPPGANCVWGGLVIQSGLDDDEDGVLQPGEVDATTYVCNGSDGLATLVRQEDEAPGTNCTDGGKAVLNGLDLDRDGYLDDTEVLSTSYVCNGPQGVPGHNSLFEAAIEPPGETCLAGGFQISSGLDMNDNGVLDTDEVQASAFLCQGLPGDDGISALVNVTDEPAGTNCFYAGQKIETGGDDNGDGTLDPAEVDFTEYACNGAPGSNGSNGVDSLVETTPEPPGGNCAGGGQRVDVGLDSDRNGTLEPAEITATEYVCDGGDIVMRVSSALWGGVCPRGGVKVESGFDDDANGILDDAEVDVEQYVCNLFFAQIALGGDHTCALVSDGTVRCWGKNDRGQVGDGTTTQREFPVAVGGLGNATDISSAGQHTCALIADGTVRCWGKNDTGELGNGTITDHESTPITVSNVSTAISIAAGGGHSCAILNDGTAVCWGSNQFGQLGDGSSDPFSTTPVAVSGLNDAKTITVGFFHTCAIHGSNDKASCWGANTDGQLGNNGTEDKNTPVAVVGLTNITSIVAGGAHTCSTLDDYTAHCWGNNLFGQLGDGTDNPSDTPVQVPGLSNANAISGGAAHTCTSLNDGMALCWGYNGNGQLGDGTTNSTCQSGVCSNPVQVTGLNPVEYTSLGWYHSCALLFNGSAACWGSNQYGQLGDGTTIDRLTPGSVPNVAPTQ